MIKSKGPIPHFMSWVNTWFQMTAMRAVVVGIIFLVASVLWWVGVKGDDPLRRDIIPVAYVFIGLMLIGAGLLTIYHKKG